MKPKTDPEPMRSLLQAAERLEEYIRVVGTADGPVPGSRDRSSRALRKLIEGWCIDIAVRDRHPALSRLDGDPTDEQILGALRTHFAAVCA